MATRFRWLAAPAMGAAASAACGEAVEPLEWYLGTDIIDKGDCTFFLTVVVLRYHSLAPDGTIVLFECEEPVLDAGLFSIEAPTVSGRASVDVTPPPTGEVWVTVSLPGMIERAGRVRLSL